jgi:glycosyltransferase involved in cell wall biosynthesis
MDYNVTILIPSYNRARFSALITHNINIQTYPSISQIIIYDDGEERCNLSKCRYPVKYVSSEKRASIGAKRNLLISMAETGFCAFMDTDDMYSADYISHSMRQLYESGKSVCGTSDMLLYSDGITYHQRCMFLDMLNEATLVFRRSHKGTFGNANSSEGVSFLQGYLGDIVESDINKVMICMVHDSNTVPKKEWCKEIYSCDFNILNQYREHLIIHLSN